MFLPPQSPPVQRGRDRIIEAKGMACVRSFDKCDKIIITGDGEVIALPVGCVTYKGGCDAKP